ncbi:uncharacterized protein LOC116014275 [Ipomoea triloba]|uniref:uncharacterized protein LOC116014275 n=1 Tax=Ipomoea triloba TaxID=35885 RepID=UPI00125D384E|nr:uncharacterized protein LOC116014275 [Ipomoea triloba]XP_031110170.1 uncharacterized protein LOC116014275 [Ipomoea triloba]XP_031110178.1 uncharacterized protein LOC116014275 [Ipomoea triloba]
MEGKFDKQNKATTYEDGIPVDVTGFTRSSVPGILTKEDPDETEYSSSFADSTSGNDNFSGPSDAEVESQFCNESGLGSSFDGFGSLFPLRKKKLTGHWRNFISPLMWRCKWIEVKLKEFKSQVTKYDREMAAYDREKHQVLDQMLLQDSGSKSIPYIHQSEKKKAMKRRRKRQRAEGMEISAYMSNHKLFSYFENKKSDPDGNSAGDELSNVVLVEQNTSTHDELVSDDFSILKHSDDLPEQILRKIELLHTRVHRLNAQLDTVMAKNALKFSSSENLSNLGFYEAQDSSVRNPTFSACNGETVSVGCLYTSTQHIGVNDFGDSIMHDGAISSFGVANPPDISESSTGFLSFVDATQHQGQVGDSGEKIVDNILAQNEAAEVEEGCLLKMNHDQSLVKNLGTEKNIADESTNPPAVPVPQPNALLKAGTSHEQSTLRACLTSEIHFPSTASKRKRGERKAGGGGWNWQKPGEPDSQ